MVPSISKLKKLTAKHLGWGLSVKDSNHLLVSSNFYFHLPEVNLSNAASQTLIVTCKDSIYCIYCD